MSRPGSYGPGYGEAPLCNMHGFYLKQGICKGCEQDKKEAVRAETDRIIGLIQAQASIERGLFGQRLMNLIDAIEEDNE